MQRIEMHLTDGRVLDLTGLSLDAVFARLARERVTSADIRETRHILPAGTLSQTAIAAAASARSSDPMREPTADEWQGAVDRAEFFLLLSSAKAYGLITGGPVVNEDRCQELLVRGKALGYEPADHDTLIRRFLTHVT
jgi:hypothetical protein